MLPSSCQNSGPDIVNIFSLHSSVRYALWISNARMSRPFNAAIVSAILTESRDTTEEYVIEVGAVVM